MGFAGLAYAMVGTPEVKDAAKAQNNVYYWANGKQMVATGVRPTVRSSITRRSPQPCGTP